MEGSLVAYKVFSNGSVLNASEINDNLMNQSVMVFSNAAARTAALTTPVDGMLTYLEDSDTYESYTSGSWITVADGTGWTTFTPTMTGLTIGNGVYNYSKYKQIGKTVHVSVWFTFGSTSAITGDLTLEVPAGIERIAATAPANCFGLFRDFNAGSNSLTAVFPLSNNAAGFSLRASNASTTYLTSTALTSTIPFTWAVSDVILFSATYEVA
jgi:hypothetical protein